jgi:hypothetical protein
MNVIYGFFKHPFFANFFAISLLQHSTSQFSKIPIRKKKLSTLLRKYMQVNLTYALHVKWKFYEKATKICILTKDINLLKGVVG